MEFANPVAVVTKGFLVVRDADVLQALHQTAEATVCVSIPFADAETAKLIEPQAPPPARRFEAVRRLSDAGIPVTVFISPVIPGLNDRDIPRILEQAAAAGAQSASYTALRLPGSVESVFVSRLREVLPLRADRVLNRLRDIRGGNLSESRFGKRMRGSGTYWKSIDDLFQISKKRCGLDREGAGSSCECRVGPAEVRTDARPPGARPTDPARSAMPLAQLSFDFQR